MYIIAGLGNPGHRFENTRHNIGFITLDKIAERNDIKINKKKYKALVGEGSISGCKVILVKPHTYMNLSGDSLREVMNFYKEEFEHLLVIYDDIDIPTGSIRIRKNGSAGTHNGMRSIVRQLGTEEFPRIRIGIGRNSGDLADYVTGGFTKDEVKPLEEAVINAAYAVECMLDKGIDIAMSRYNMVYKLPKG